MVTAAVDNGEVAFVELESRLGETCQMRNPWPGACRVIELEGDTHELDGEILRFDTKRGKRYQVLPKGKPQPEPRRISPRRGLCSNGEKSNDPFTNPLPTRLITDEVDEVLFGQTPCQCQRESDHTD